MADLANIKKALEVWPHQSLYGIATAEPEKPLDSPKPVAERVKNTVSDTQMPLFGELMEDERLLAFNIVTSLFVPYKQRGIELKFSMRKLEKAADSLVSREMIKQVSIGRNIFLAPTEKLYQYLSMASPYKRNISVEHSFSVLFARWCIDGDPAVHKTVIEAPIDDSGRTGDMIAYLKNGDRHIYEITLNNSNCASNAAKVRGKGFSKIIFVCRDHNIRKATQIILGDAGFEPEFFSTIECVLFSDLIHAKAERSK